MKYSNILDLLSDFGVVYLMSMSTQLIIHNKCYSHTSGVVDLYSYNSKQYIWLYASFCVNRPMCCAFSIAREHRNGNIHPPVLSCA